MRTTLDLPDPLFRMLKARAALDGTSLKDLVIRLVQRGLSEPTPAEPTERAPFPVLIPATGQPFPVPAELLSNAGLMELATAEEDARSLALMRGQR
ncbi:hypothetical protein [Xylophilus ampelinus]|uniref:Uncharacterized protein n=1 Tax=Xylophilus ampelinus TaxID=54067 RepID=A0A318SLK6_9BURK|nr:hypothetical protein [Xylophilus ampelinus]MCS4510246.1 hypothetical protein [Xylophilus ampelinus]PYE78132.1 hypothetical protein DFQ15_10945 [Xylophilus ampelinus]